MAHIRTLKQASNHGLILKKVQNVLKFNQKAWLKPSIKVWKEFKLKDKAVFGKTMEKVRKHRDIKLVTTN